MHVINCVLSEKNTVMCQFVGYLKLPNYFKTMSGKVKSK